VAARVAGAAAHSTGLSIVFCVGLSIVFCVASSYLTDLFTVPSDREEDL
jgi:hypothetical protein